MASITSRRREESILYPGVHFEIAKINEGRRRTLRLSLADTNRKLRTLIAKRIKLEDEIEALQKAEETVSFDLLDQRADILEQLDSIQMIEVNPAWMKFGLAGIEGIDVDGVALTPESIDNAPSDLYYEILGQIQRELGLTQEQQGLSQSPTTSTASEDGKAKPTIVTPASDAAGTADETVVSIPPQ